MCLKAIGSCWRLRSRGWSGEMYRLRPYLVLEYLSSSPPLHRCPPLPPPPPHYTYLALPSWHHASLALAASGMTVGFGTTVAWSLDLTFLWNRSNTTPSWWGCCEAGHGRHLVPTSALCIYQVLSTFPWDLLSWLKHLRVPWVAPAEPEQFQSLIRGLWSPGSLWYVKGLGEFFIMNSRDCSSVFLRLWVKEKCIKLHKHVHTHYAWERLLFTSYLILCLWQWSELTEKHSQHSLTCR